MSDKVKESVVIRGICNSLDKMHMPTIANVNALLEKFDYKIIKIKKQQNDKSRIISSSKEDTF